MCAYLLLLQEHPEWVLLTIFWNVSGFRSRHNRHATLLLPYGPLSSTVFIQFMHIHSLLQTNVIHIFHEHHSNTHNEAKKEWKISQDAHEMSTLFVCKIKKITKNKICSWVLLTHPFHSESSHNKALNIVILHIYKNFRQFYHEYKVFYLFEMRVGS